MSLAMEARNFVLPQLLEQLRCGTLGGTVHHVEDWKASAVPFHIAPSCKSHRVVFGVLTFFDAIFVGLAMLRLLMRYAFCTFVVVMLEWPTLCGLEAFWSMVSQHCAAAGDAYARPRILNSLLQNPAARIHEFETVSL